MAYDEIEPLGPRRDRDMLALHGANLSAAWGFPIELDKFDPWNDDAPDDDEPMSDEELQANLERLTSQRPRPAAVSSAGRGFEKWSKG
jgi:hypothetical protein